MIRIEPGWIDTSGRTRTWRVLDVDGMVIVEATTKRGAETVKALLEADR